MKRLIALLLLVPAVAGAQPVNPIISGGTSTSSSGGSATNVGVSTSGGLLTTVTNGSADFTIVLQPAAIGAVTSTNALNATLATTSVTATNAWTVLPRWVYPTNAGGSQIPNYSNQVVYFPTGIVAGDFAFATNLAPAGRIWQEMPVPERFVSSFVENYCSPTEQWVTNKIQELLTNGMYQAGWRTIMIEDGQFAGRQNGRLIENSNAFPKGLIWLTQYAHDRGFKISSYLSYSSTGCCTNSVASPEQYLADDIKRQMEFGFDGLMVDACSLDQQQLTVDRMRRLVRTFNDVVFNQNSLATNGYASTNRGMWLEATSTVNPSGGIWPPDGNQFEQVPWESAWGMNIIGVPWYFATINQPHTTNWNKTLAMCERYAWAVKPGCFLLPTSFVPGSYNDNTMVSALNFYGACVGPLQIGNQGLVQLARLNNREFQAIQQDPACIMSWMVTSNATTEIHLRPLGRMNSGTNFITLFNKSDVSATNVTVTASQLGYRSNDRFIVRDPWSQRDLFSTNGSFTVSVTTNTIMGLVTKLVPEQQLESVFNGGAGLVAWVSPGLGGFRENDWVTKIADRVNGNLWFNGDNGGRFGPMFISTNLGGTFIHPVWGSQYASSMQMTQHIAQPFHLFMTMIPNGTAMGTLWHGTNVTSATAFGFSDGKIYLNAGSQISYTPSATQQVVEFYCNGASSYIKTNGATAASGNIGTTDLRGITIGGNYSGFNATLGVAANCQIGDVMVFSGTQSATVLTNATEFLMRRIGMLSGQQWQETKGNDLILNSNLTVNGTVTAGAFSGNGASLTTLNANNISSGTVPTARLGSGTANSTTYLRGDQTWATISGGSGYDFWNTNAAGAGWWTNKAGWSNVISGASSTLYGTDPFTMIVSTPGGGDPSRFGSGIYVDAATDGDVYFIGDVTGPTAPGDFNLHDGTVNNLTVLAKTINPHVTSSSATSGTVTAASTYWDETTYFNSGSTITSITLALPTTTVAGQIFRLHSKSAVTTLAVTGGSFVDTAVVTLAAGGNLAYQAIDTSGTYIRLQ